jgi:phenylalanyl-tRNA synthetase beta chain
MRISYNWLKEYIKTDLSPAKIAQRLTDSGLEVEAVEEVESVPGGLKGLVIGEVVEHGQHPNADRLSVTKVNVGGEEILGIVCGAPNVAAGQKVVVATVGTTLFPTEGESFKIKKGKIRGEVSMGMICAEDEIGLGKEHDGIMVLNDKAIVGSPAADYFNLESDYAIEIGLTPNRTDGMSHIGVARDLAAVLSLEENKKVKTEWPSVKDFKADNTKNPIEVIVENEEACPRYVGLRLSNVKVADSPEWLQNRLKTIGLAPINNIVDISNFVLHEMGQPLHAFDAGKIKGNKVIVKTLPNKTKFETLDEKVRELSDHDLMICDADHGMCIAGVFGGIGSGVGDNTTEVFLESAYFNPVWVRKTAKRHGLNTDASFRFERGIDPELTVYAIKRAALLMKEIAGATITSEIIDVYPKKFVPFKVDFNKKRCDSLIGKAIGKDTVKFILDTLDIKVLEENGDDWLLEVPQYRADVTREADVVEEILRIYGFNNIEIPEKIHASLSYSHGVNPENMIRSTSDFLASRGFNEMMANSLTSDRYVEQNQNSNLSLAAQIPIVNPLSSDLNVMRQTLLFNGLETVAYNQNRQHPDLMLFEFGNVYRMMDEYSENFRMAIYLSGKTQPNNWNRPAAAFTFFDLKGEVNAILKKLGLYHRIETADTQWEVFEEGIDLNINKKALVHLGIVNGELIKQFDIKGHVFYADFDWDYLFSLLKTGHINIADLPKFPAVRRDLSLLLDKAVTFKAIRDLAFKTERKLLKSVELFDVYEGKGMEPGQKSYAVSFVLQDTSKTLNDKTIDKSMNRIQQALEKELGARLRG